MKILHSQILISALIIPQVHVHCILLLRTGLEWQIVYSAYCSTSRMWLYVLLPVTAVMQCKTLLSYFHTQGRAWSPHLRLRCDTSELITHKSDTSQSYWHFLVHTMSIIINLTPPHVNHYPPHMTTFCQFKVLLFFWVFYQLTLTVIVLQTVNTALMVWSTVIITESTTAHKTSKSIYSIGKGTTHYMCLFSAGIKPKLQQLKFQFSPLDMLDKHVCLVLVQKVFNRATAFIM